MNRSVPPAFLQHIVLALLPPRDQETIAGDLLEAYADRRSISSAAPANLWYTQQALSLVPRAAAVAYRSTPSLVLLCCFTALCGAWLGVMGILLHHRNLRGEVIAALIVVQALLTLFVLPLKRIVALRWAAVLGGVAIMWVGASALVSMLRGDHSWEGYILIIAFLLVIQAALTWRALLRRQPATA